MAKNVEPISQAQPFLFSSENPAVKLRQTARAAQFLPDCKHSKRSGVTVLALIISAAILNTNARLQPWELAPVQEKRDFITRGFLRAVFAECLRFFSSRLATTAAAIFLALFPIALALRVMRHNRSSVPYGDDWDTPGSQIIAFLNGTLRFGDLFQQHNESRPLIPKLCYLALFAATGRWDPKDAMALTFVLACVGSLLLYQLLRRTTTFTFRSRVLACALLNAIWFCPPQYEHFVWSILLVSFIPGVAVLASQVVNQSDLQLAWKVVINSILALIATYTFANGMLLWLLAIPICPTRQQSQPKNRLNFVVCYVAYFLCATLSIWSYLHGYAHPVQHPEFATSFSDALPLLQFFLTWIGTTFALPGADPLLLGCFFVGAFILLLLIAVRVARQQQTFWRFYSWIVIALYAVISGAVIAFGRLRFGMATASAERYIPESVFFYLGFAGLSLTLWDSRRMFNHAQDVRVRFMTGLVIRFFAVGWLVLVHKELARIELIHQERKDLALAVQWIPAIPSNSDLALAWVPPKVIVEKSVALAKHDALRPQFIPASLVSAVQNAPAQGEPGIGTLESAEFAANHHLLVAGTAWLEERHARPDCIVMGYVDSESGWTPFAVFEPFCKRERLKGHVEFNRGLPSKGFAGFIDGYKLPPRTLTLRAFAVDMRAAHAFALAGAVTVHNELLSSR